MKEPFPLFQFGVGKETLNFIDTINYISNNPTIRNGHSIKFLVGNNINENELKFCFREIYCISNVLLSYGNYNLHLLISPSFEFDKIKVIFDSSDFKDCLFGIPISKINKDRNYDNETWQEQDEKFTINYIGINELNKNKAQFKTITQKYFDNNNIIVAPCFDKLLFKDFSHPNESLPSLNLNDELWRIVSCDLESVIIYPKKLKEIEKLREERSEANWQAYLSDKDSLWDDAFGDSQDSAIGHW